MKSVFVLLVIITTAVAQTGAKVGMSFLKVGVDARAAAMGNAYCASTTDAAAMYWNPAGLAGASSNSVVLMHNIWLQDIFHEFAAAQIMTGRHSLGVSLNWMRVPGIQLRGESATEEPDGETSVDYVSLGFSYATILFEDWYAGIQLKYLYERYYLENANGYAIDIGIMRKLPVAGMLWGITLQNIGKMGKVRDKKTNLPVLVRTGINYTIPWHIFNNYPVLVADYLLVADDVSQLGLGTEVSVFNNLALRTGYIFSHESAHITLGVGVAYSVYDFAYAYVPYKYDLGDSHRFSLRILF